MQEPPKAAVPSDPAQNIPPAPGTSALPSAQPVKPVNKPVLGYWNIRGLAQPLRYLLTYKEVDFEDKRYNSGPGSEYDFSEWAEAKKSLELRFPSLPYYLDGDARLTQSLAIIRYLARKYDLDAKDEKKKHELDLMEQQVCELRWGTGRVIFSLNFEESRNKFIALLPQTLEPYAGYLKEKNWVLGDRISYVDFMMYETLDWMRTFWQDALKDSVSLKSYCDRFEDLPPIKAYRSSNSFICWPVSGPLAKSLVSFSPATQ